MPRIFSEVRPRDGGPDRRKEDESPVDVLVDTVARMQQDLASLRAENRLLRTPAVPQVVRAPRQAAFTMTKVPRFDGTISWEQYRQVFGTIVQSNGWANDTAALQLFSNLEGDALNVALLVPLSRPLLRTGLVDALTAHYGSPGRLADYRRQFERTTRTMGEDPAIFATSIETLAVKAFGDMGQTACLRLIWDRFIAVDVVDLAAFGRATPTRQFVGLVNLVRIRFIQLMWWETQTISVRRHGWRRSPGCSRVWIS